MTDSQRSTYKLYSPRLCGVLMHASRSLSIFVYSSCVWSVFWSASRFGELISNGLTFGGTGTGFGPPSALVRPFGTNIAANGNFWLYSRFICSIGFGALGCALSFSKSFWSSLSMLLQTRASFIASIWLALETLMLLLDRHWLVLKLSRGPLTVH